MNYRATRTAVGMKRSQRDYSEASACMGKIRYTAWLHAEAVVQRIIVENLDADEAHKSNGLGVYRCEYCAYWHVGHSRGPRVIEQRHGENWKRLTRERRAR